MCVCVCVCVCVWLLYRDHRHSDDQGHRPGGHRQRAAPVSHDTHTHTHTRVHKHTMTAGIQERLQTTSRKTAEKQTMRGVP